MPEIIDIYGNKKSISCIACAIQSGEAETPGGVIAESEYFRAEADYEYPIPGFVIIVSKRHFFGIDEMSANEQTDFIGFVCSVRRAMRKALNIEHVHIVLEEDTTSSHFHLWIFPRYAWMEKQFGKKIESVKPIMEYAKQHLTLPKHLTAVERAVVKLRDLLGYEKTKD